MNKRKNTDIVCKVCGIHTKTNGLANHIKNTHNLSIEKYISIYGEYRTKYINYQNRSSDNFLCKICNTKHASERHLSYHIKGVHNISKKEYVIQYILNGNIPKCKCGCGTNVKIKDKGSPPYYSEYISGHNTGSTHIGMKRSMESRMKMRESAIIRLQNENSVFYKGVSNDELNLLDFIKSIYFGEIIHNDTKILNGLELDIVLSDLNIAIELNGDRFHSDLYKTRQYHLKKTIECESKGIRLIHIWLCDWLSKSDIIKSQLNSIIGIIPNKIYARNCEIKEVDYITSNLFLTKNHLQGTTVSKWRYGLYYNNELVQLITFGKLRKATGRNHIDNSYELLRLCTKTNTVVIGGASKLYKHFIKINNPTYIISFSNRDWSIGNVYKKLGMEFVKYTPVGYFYSNGKRKEHRFRHQKHILVKLGFDKNKTEYQIMSERGYYRIWNTGNAIYEYNITKKGSY
jgi:hypothetical protein